jgi:hypothetical protein
MPWGSALQDSAPRTGVVEKFVFKVVRVCEHSVDGDVVS